MRPQRIFDHVEKVIWESHLLNEDQKREMCNRIFSVVNHTPRDTKKAQWTALHARILRVRKSMEANRHRWNPVLAPINEEYVSLLDRVAALVKYRSEEFPDQSITQYGAVWAKKNKELNRQLSIYGERNTKWQTWIPLDVRQAFRDKYETVRQKHDIKGSALVPFMPRHERLDTLAQIKRRRTDIDNTRRCAATSESTAPTLAKANTPYRALYLAACRQADMKLDAIVRELNDYRSPMLAPPTIPVNWRALLTPELRERLRHADEAPRATHIEGLTSFLDPVADADVADFQPEKEDTSAEDDADFEDMD
jgi:hypothetical protein